MMLTLLSEVVVCFGFGATCPVLVGTERIASSRSHRTYQEWPVSSQKKQLISNGAGAKLMTRMNYSHPVNS